VVTFVTLFLGLISGIHPVQLAVDGPVARVELELDGEVVASIDGPPWVTRCDFGDRIAPRELVAVAYDATGSELDRALQMVNLPRPSAEIHVAFETGDDGMPEAARLIWEVADNSEPLSVFATLDGAYLIPDEIGRYPLGEYDPAAIHIFSAEARFADEITARTDVTFGGQYGARITAELTAVPIVVEGEPPRADDLAGAFSIAGRNLAVAVVDQPRAEIYLVREMATLARMSHLRARQEKLSPWRRGRSLSSPPPEADEDRLRVVVPNPVRRRDRQLFPTSPPIDLERLPLSWLATRVKGDGAAFAGQKLAEAVAVAGVQAASTGTPRAILAIVSDRPADVSLFSIDEIRHYLEQIRVPLFVWSVGGEAPAAWGPSEDVTTSRHLKAASKRLLMELDRQWIVWVEGSHMVNRIELNPAVEGVRLAGVGDGDQRQVTAADSSVRDSGQRQTPASGTAASGR
jgi:hypothetical protein